MEDQKLKDHLELNTSKLDTYSKVKSEIREYLTAKKKWTPVIGGDHTKQKKDDDAMDLDALWAKLKGEKGYGKGKDKRWGRR